MARSRARRTPASRTTLSALPASPRGLGLRERDFEMSALFFICRQLVTHDEAEVKPELPVALGHAARPLLDYDSDHPRRATEEEPWTTTDTPHATKASDRRAATKQPMAGSRICRRSAVHRRACTGAAARVRARRGEGADRRLGRVDPVAAAGMPRAGRRVRCGAELHGDPRVRAAA